MGGPFDRVWTSELTRVKGVQARGMVLFSAFYFFQCPTFPLVVVIRPINVICVFSPPRKLPILWTYLHSNRDHFWASFLSFAHEIEIVLQSLKAWSPQKSWTREPLLQIMVKKVSYENSSSVFEQLKYDQVITSWLIRQNCWISVQCTSLRFLPEKSWNARPRGICFVNKVDGKAESRIQANPQQSFVMFACITDTSSLWTAPQKVGSVTLNRSCHPDA